MEVFKQQSQQPEDNLVEKTEKENNNLENEGKFYEVLKKTRKDLFELYPSSFIEQVVKIKEIFDPNKMRVDIGDFSTDNLEEINKKGRDREYTETNKNLFRLLGDTKEIIIRNLTNISVIPENHDKIRKAQELIQRIDKIIITSPHCPPLAFGHIIPLTLENFSEINEKQKQEIEALVQCLRKEYNLTDHWERNRKWEIAEVMGAFILQKFLNKYYTAILSSRYDDIANKHDLFLCPLEHKLPNIAIDITTKRNVKNKEHKFKRFVYNPQNIEYGIEYKNNQYISKKIEGVFWFWARIDNKLLDEYIEIIKDEKEIEKKERVKEIEKMIFNGMSKDIINQFQMIKQIESSFSYKYKEIEKLINKKNKEGKQDQLFKKKKEEEEKFLYIRERLKKLKPFLNFLYK